MSTTPKKSSKQFQKSKRRSAASKILEIMNGPPPKSGRKRKAATSSLLGDGIAKAPIPKKTAPTSSIDRIEWLAECANKAGHNTISTALALCQIAARQNCSVTSFKVKDLMLFGQSENAVRRHLEKLESAEMFTPVVSERRGVRRVELPFVRSKTNEESKVS